MFDLRTKFKMFLDLLESGYKNNWKNLADKDFILMADIAGEMISSEKNKETLAQMIYGEMTDEEFINRLNSFLEERKRRANNIINNLGMNQKQEKIH